MITYRKATADDIQPAFELALRVFMEYEAPDYGQEGENHFCEDAEAKMANPDLYLSGKRLLFIALDGEKIIGMIESREIGHVAMLFVDGTYHRQGIATALMDTMICALKLRGYDHIGVNSSPYGLPFYLQYGFKPIDVEQHKDGFIFTPMEYTPNEIWDVYDRNRTKTGRYAERGRPMAPGDYHLVVHVWKHNGKGEWLIDKRTSRTSDDLGGMWETTGGSALAGEDSLTAAVREAKEELGINLDSQKGTIFRSYIPDIKGHSAFYDVWVFEYDYPIESVVFDGTEICDAMWASSDKIREMMATGEFLSKCFYPYFDEMAEKWEEA